ncbi:MAG: hypothetical protein L6Q74_06915 [Sphaerotilus natans subsp. sulfidivorans]|uniref:hypothetical protein n=1 Tax=Sphaerotilus sulfidivorans TaxID=639200 RepID=UPI002352FA06|nr:hypothetical protein [Sphaerotilus sulfidivorans]MCK6401623.1 hypothetical protein [Sphaerotilus sulfidivorans]
MSRKTIAQAAPQPAFQPLSGPGAELKSPTVEALCRIHDLSDGACLLAQILECEAEEEAFEGGRPMFSARDRSRLFGLLVTTAGIVANEAARLAAETATNSAQGGQ